MNKRQVMEMITRLESQALHWEGYHGRGTDKVQADARRVRRFLNSERQQILRLRRYVSFAARELEKRGAPASMVAEVDEAAKPKAAR